MSYLSNLKNFTQNDQDLIEIEEKGEGRPRGSASRRSEKMMNPLGGAEIRLFPTYFLPIPTDLFHRC